jgi:hypothetical protein
VGLEETDLDGDGLDVPADIEAGIAKVGAEAFAAEGAVGHGTEEEATFAKCEEYIAGVFEGRLAAFDARDVGGFEEPSRLVAREFEPDGLERRPRDLAVVRFDEVGGAGAAHGVFHGGPCGAGDGRGVFMLDGERGKGGGGAFGGEAAELGGRWSRPGVPEGVADIEEDCAKRHGNRRGTGAPGGRPVRSRRAMIARGRYADNREGERVETRSERTTRG